MQIVDGLVEQFSIHAEQSVIGALLLDNDSADRMGDLRPEHFYHGDHRAIFAEMMRQISAGKSVDVITLYESLLGAGISGEIGGLPYLNEIMQNTPSAINIGRYSAIVRDKAIKRGLIALGHEVAGMAASSMESSEVLIDRASSKLEKLGEARIKEKPIRASDEMFAHIEELERRREGTGARAISTGFEDLDKRLNGGMRRGELIVVAARPKMGKTAFSTNVALNIARDHSVLMLSMEMPKSQLHDRNLAALGRIPLEHLLQPADMTLLEWEGLTTAIKKINELSLYLDDQGGLRLLDVRMKAKQIKRQHCLDVMVIDYLQLMEGDGESRNAQIESITRGLKALAKELNIAIILLSQLNRELEKRPNKRPQPSDLRDSGAIEQDADAVIFLYRDEVYNSDTLDKGICEIDVALCRMGAPGRAALKYVGEQTRFEPAFQWTPRSPKPLPRRGIADYL